MNQRYLLYALLTLLAGASWWLTDVFKPEQRPAEKAAKHSADYFSYGLTKTTMTPEGIPGDRVVAEKMTHYKDDDTIELLKPTFTFFKPDAPPWVVVSERGHISSDGLHILLGGAVRIRRSAAPNIRPVEVITSDLMIHRDTNIAETSKHADIISPPDRIEGVGMRVHFEDPKTLTLLSKVHGKHEYH